MDDYIKREDAVVYVLWLIDRIYEGIVAPRDIRKEAKQQVIKEMNSTEILPSAEVRENVRGRWVRSRLDPDFVTCSVCKKNKDPNAMAWKKSYIKGLKRTFKFCPICGAEMRGKKHAT